MVQEEHSLRLVGRAELTITGVTEVSRFEEDGVLLQTDMGELTVQGEQLQLKELSLEGGRVAVSGSISATPMAADRPGRQPMMMPRATPPAMARMLAKERALIKP